MAFAETLLTVLVAINSSSGGMTKKSVELFKKVLVFLWHLKKVKLNE